MLIDKFLRGAGALSLLTRDAFEMSGHSNYKVNGTHWAQLFHERRIQYLKQELLTDEGIESDNRIIAPWPMMILDVWKLNLLKSKVKKTARKKRRVKLLKITDSNDEIPRSNFKVRVLLHKTEERKPRRRRHTNSKFVFKNCQSLLTISIGEISSRRMKLVKKNHKLLYSASFKSH